MAKVQQNDEKFYTKSDIINNIYVLKTWDDDQKYITLREASTASPIYGQIYDCVHSHTKDMFTLDEFMYNKEDYIVGSLDRCFYENFIADAVQIDISSHSVSLMPISLKDIHSQENRYLENISPVTIHSSDYLPRGRIFALFEYDAQSDSTSCFYLIQEDEILSLYSFERDDNFESTDDAGFIGEFIDEFIEEAAKESLYDLINHNNLM